MLVNNLEVVDRHNRPSVSQRVGLRVFFINDGMLQDPISISAVGIWNASSNFYPSSLLNEDGLISSSVTGSDLIKMNFSNSSADTSNSAFNVSNYTGGQTASGIYKLGTGQYIVILDGTLDLTGYQNYYEEDVYTINRASGTGDYVDIWTVKLLAASDYKTIINSFSLKDDTFFSITEPLLLKAHNRLAQKHITIGSKVDLKIETEINIENRNIGLDIQNLFRDSVITSASVQITKLNEDSNLPSRVIVSSFAETSALVDVTADNTLVFNWDTSRLSTHPAVTGGTFGNLTGSYYLQVKYGLLNQIIVSDLMHFIVR